MSEFLHHAAGAALPIAIGLLILAATGRLALAADLDDARTRRLAGQYLGPLSTWCLVAVAVYVIALAGAGDAGMGALALALGLCAAALAVRLSADEEPAAGAHRARVRRGAATAPPAPGDRRPSADHRPDAATSPAGDRRPSAGPTADRPPSPVASGGGLWAEPDEDHARSGLWSR
jgi:hypothetical protein